MNKDTSSSDYLVLKTELRSLLISSQQGCSEQQLIRDYAAYNSNKEIPFRRMGYTSLIELLRSMPDVARIDQTRVPVIIHGIPDQSTVHIKKFVMSQRKNRKAANARRGMSRSNYANNSSSRFNGSTTYPRNRQGPSYSHHTGVPFQPYSQLSNAPKNVWDATDLSYTSYPTTISNPIGSNKPFTTAVKAVASFPPKESRTPPLISSSEIISIRATPINDDASSMIDGDLNYSEDDELAAYDAQQASEHGEKIILLRKRIRQLLLKYQSGLWLSSVHKLYKKSFAEDLNFEEFQLKNLMALFDCISDFVDSQRDRIPDSTDRLLLLKSQFIEATRREQQSSLVPTSSYSSPKDTQDSSPLPVNGIDRPIVDLSSFVPLDFQYKSIELTSTEPFLGFLGDVEDPWNIHIGNIQFQSKRDRMMIELREHYNQSSDQAIYIIPFEQIQIHLSCVYYHTDRKYYRAFIYHIDPTRNHDILILKIYLVDYGLIISNINYHPKSDHLKFLHRNFATLSTQVYGCRLANVCYPPTSNQWSDNAREFIIDLCHGIKFSVQVIGFLESFYSIYLWIDEHHQQSINELLIQRGFAIQLDETQYPEFEPLSSNMLANGNNNYIDGKLLSREERQHLQYDIEENNYKHFIISIEHAYYFIKHPFTKRPCLPCFEVARLLNKDETYVSQLNLIRETEVQLTDSYRRLFEDLRALNESNRCPHIHRKDDSARIILYDLSSVRDYLCKIKFKEGDVIDAFEQEYENYERPGYWNEKKNSYINNDSLQIHQENLYQQRNLLNFRREQLVSLSKTSHHFSPDNEMQQIEHNLNHINQELHSMEIILPNPKPSKNIKTSNSKMRDTLFRIARPFDQQFALNIRFNHQSIDPNRFNDDEEEEIEERFEDLYRITKNVIQFFILESEILDDKSRILLTEADNLSADLLQTDHLSFSKRIEIYNYCLQLIEYFQPTIRYYVQRTDLIDTIY